MRVEGIVRWEYDEGTEKRAECSEPDDGRDRGNHLAVVRRGDEIEV